jgi:hypothetical protein
METKLSKDITDKLAIKDLQQVFDRDIVNGGFVFLGLGKLFLNYRCKVVHGDDFAARLAGCDHPYELKRTGLESSHITIPLPKDSTNYYLGEMDSNEELYINHRENSFSRDFASIIFLKKN